MSRYLFFFLYVCYGAWTPNRPFNECDTYWTWGPEDERGANNYQTPEKVLEAIELIKTGKVYDLSHVFDSKMPLFPGRSYQLVIPDVPVGLLGNNGAGWNDDFLAASIGQIGTQYDGLTHIVTVEEDSSGLTKHTYYNGFTGKDVNNGLGMKKLGVEKLRPFFTRGIMLDFARHRGVEFLEQGEVIRIDEFFDVLREQGLRRSDITEGSYVLIHMGQYKVRLSDPAAYIATWPGLDLECAEWLAKQGVSVVGSDGLTPFVHPNPDYPESNASDHQFLIMCAGMGVSEQVNSQQLAEDQVYEFAWSFTPLKLRGATGSPGAGIAIV